MIAIKALHTYYFVGRFMMMLLCMIVYTGTGYAQQSAKEYFRADQQISFKWRFGYSEFPFPDESVAAREDAEQGRYGWYDGALWSQAYKAWDGSALHAVQLLFRGGSPYAREVKCLSEKIPYEKAGTPVSFLLPFRYTIGTEEDIAFALQVKGVTAETIVCKLQPRAMTAFTGGLFKINFIALSVETPPGVKPLVNVTGLMHIRVYPSMINYGNRMEFIFSSVTHHMDVESSLLIGSVYKDVSSEDPYKLAARVQPAADSFSAARSLHERKLSEWRRTTALQSAQLMKKGRVEVSTQGPEQPRDRGELRVSAYSGNPVKDFQYGPPSDQMKAMAQRVTGALGRRFSVFRYQHHYLPWKLDNPAELDSLQLPYLRQWLEAAGSSADTVILDLQLSPIVKLYKEYSQMGQIALPAAGIPGAEWDRLRQGYFTAISYAKKICPSLRIIQMPYEMDNIARTEQHSDAHYHFFKSLYEAVAQYNAGRKVEDQLMVAGLGCNNPNGRWDFIAGFLKRYSNDTATDKRLDYITWHTYLFPGNYPSMIRGYADSLQKLLVQYHLDKQLPVIVDEMGLAEPSTIEDLSDLYGAQQKEAAMAAFTCTLQDYYDKEPGNFIPVSGGGWHFALLTYGRQQVLSAYAKGMLLRNKLGDQSIPVKTFPLDDNGYGLHAMATRDKDKISVLLFSASPSIFYESAAPLNYKDIDLLLKDLPENFSNNKLTVTQWLTGPGDSTVQQILSQDQYQTLPLTRGADRYDKDFSPADVQRLNAINRQTETIVAGKKHLTLSVSLPAYSMLLVEIVPVKE